MPISIDPVTLVLSLLGSAGIAVAAARFMAESLVKHALAVDLEKRKGELAVGLA